MFGFFNRPNIVQKSPHKYLTLSRANIYSKDSYMWEIKRAPQSSVGYRQKTAPANKAGVIAMMQIVTALECILDRIYGISCKLCQNIPFRVKALSVIMPQKRGLQRRTAEPKAIITQVELTATSPVNQMLTILLSSAVHRNTEIPNLPLCFRNS